jgi:hypothetical protein
MHAELGIGICALKFTVLDNLSFFRAQLLRTPCRTRPLQQPWREQLRIVADGGRKSQFVFVSVIPPDHLLLDSAPNLGPLISRWEINKFENCLYKSIRILEVLKLFFMQFLNLSSSQRDMSGPILGDLSKDR